MEQISQAVSVMGMGMVGIFFVMGAISLAIYMLNKFFK